MTTTKRTRTRTMITTAFTTRLRASGFDSGARDGPPMLASSLGGIRERLVYGDIVSLSNQPVSIGDVAYTWEVPKLWNKTIEAHRREVRGAIVNTTVGLVAEHGLLSVSMSRIAEETGIGRATLYKYFADVETILSAWLERHIDAHLAHLAEVRDHASNARERLAGVLEAYAVHAHESHEHRDSELVAVLHRDKQIARREHQLHDMLRDLLSEAAQTGIVRDDVSPAELAGYCLHALAAASTLPSKAAVRRLVAVTLDGLQPSAGRLGGAQTVSPR